jgi:hypothetical protein
MSHEMLAEMDLDEGRGSVDSQRAAEALQAELEQGLCLLCWHRERCRFPRSQRVLQCDEFTPSEGRKLPLVSCADQPETPERAPAVRGLCVNCARLEGCTYPKPEGGVWRCEEYC